MLEIVFLGTGSGVPTKARNHAAIWLRYEADCMLWDCGEGTQRQLLSAGLNFMKIDDIFITHWHADHWAGLIGLIQTMNLEKRRETLHIWGPDAERFVGDILDLDYWGPAFEIIAHDVPSRGNSVSAIKEAKGYKILSIPMLHTVPSVAYCFQESDSWNVDLEKAKAYGLRQSPVIGKLKERGKITHKGKEIRLEDVAVCSKGVKAAYTGDTAPCKNIETLANEADMLIHDATFDSEQENRMHSGAKEAAEIAKAAKVTQLVLTHFSRRYTSIKPLLEEAKKVFPSTIAAHDFLGLELKRKKPASV